MISDEMSMNKDTTPSAITARGMPLTAIKPGGRFTLLLRAITKLVLTNWLAHESKPHSSSSGN